MRKQCVPGASPFFVRAGDEAMHKRVAVFSRKSKPVYVCIMHVPLIFYAAHVS